eukprot:768765-Hanusia_phi.AAC.7
MPPCPMKTSLGTEQEKVIPRSQGNSQRVHRPINRKAETGMLRSLLSRKPASPCTAWLPEC